VQRLIYAYCFAWFWQREVVEISYIAVRELSSFVNVV